jgi:hypothetical protein
VRRVTEGSGRAGKSDGLSARLAESSSGFAVSALAAMSDGKHSVFLLHSATALEHLAKAALAARHPSLIAVAAKDNFESLLLLVGETKAAKPGAKIRTIGAREALDRAGRYAPECTALIDDLRLLIWVRDGVVHLADASAATVHEVLVPYLKASEELREVLGIDRGAYWNGFVDLVDEALKEHVEQARLRVEAALAVARREFERRFAKDSDGAKKAVLTAIEESYFPLEKYEEQPLDCPACGTPAVVSGALHEEYDEDWDHREGILVGVHLLVRFIPIRLPCRACHLRLSGRDEMDAAGIGESWYLDDVDERDFLGDWGDFEP